MTDLRADSMTGEQWVLEERTADPTSTEEGERWLRADLNSGDKIATLRVDVGTTILNVPVFSSGSAVDVSEAMRVQVNGTTAYVPLAPVSDAAYPELRMQHSGATYGFHDAVEISAIPDSEVYLHDDWGDNKIQNRDESGTTTYNGVEGVYRPEWTIDSGSPAASNQALQITGGDGIYTDLNLDLNETITWEFDGSDTTGSDTNGGDNIWYHLWTEQVASRTSSEVLYESYSFRDLEGSPTGKVQLYHCDASGNLTILINAGQVVSGNNDFTVTRSPSGEFELLINGTSQGTATDTNLTNPQYSAIIGRGGIDASLNEMKIS